MATPAKISKLSDCADEQLYEFKKNHQKVSLMTTGAGSPVVMNTATLSAGKGGPLLLQDFVFIDEIAHFNRERIPERVVHAKGAGAFGEFEVTNDVTEYCKAKVFEVGRITKVAVRFATTHGEKGSADTVRDPRGFAVKFYTEEGIWDLVGLHLPIFFISDPIIFPSLVHSQKKNPVTNLEDANMFWDFIVKRPETINMVTRVFSDLGTPDGYRFMNGYGCHAFKMVNAEGNTVYCKFQFKPEEVKTLTNEEAKTLQSENPDYATRELYNAIASKNYPWWDLYIQIMTVQKAEALIKMKKDPFDVTKEWLKQNIADEQKVGRLTLKQNPKNYFADVEQIAFSPSNLVPGIEPSPDKMLQGRMFAYPDTQRYRLGTNYLQIPVNCPFQVNNYQRNGGQCVTDNQDGAPNYHPNSYNGPEGDDKYSDSAFPVSGEAGRYPVTNVDNFSQAGTFYKSLDEERQQHLITNVAGHLIKAQSTLQNKAVSLFCKVDETFGKGVESLLKPELMTE